MFTCHRWAYFDCISHQTFKALRDTGSNLDEILFRKDFCLLLLSGMVHYLTIPLENESFSAQCHIASISPYFQLEPFLLKAEVTLRGIQALPQSMAPWAIILHPTGSNLLQENMLKTLKWTVVRELVCHANLLSTRFRQALV